MNSNMNNMNSIDNVIRQNFHEIPTVDYTAPTKETLYGEQWAAIKRACDQLAYLYDGDLYVGDMIMEVAEVAAPIDNKEVMRAYEDVESFIAEVLADGWVDLDPRTFSVPRLVRAGYCRFLEAAMYENLRIIFYNRFATTANADPLLTGEDPDEDPPVDLSKLEDLLWSIAGKVDNNMTFADVDTLYRESVAVYRKQEESIVAPLTRGTILRRMTP